MTVCVWKLALRCLSKARFTLSKRDFKHYGPHWRLWRGGATRTITAHLSHLGLTDFADSPLGDQFVMDVCDGLGQKHSHPWRIPEWASPSFSIGDRIADRPAPRQLLNSHGVKIDFQRHLKRAYAELLNLGTKKTDE